MFSVGDSLKCYMEYTSTKLSDLQGFHSVSDMLHGNWGGRGKVEHLDKVKRELGMSDKQQKDAATYWDNGPGKIMKTIGAQFTKGEFYDNGKFRQTSPKDAAKMVMDNFKKKKGMTFENLSESDFEKIFYTGKKENRKMVDMNDPTEQERVKEQLQRLMVTAKFNKDLQGGVNKTKARHVAAFMVWTSCGSYYDDANDIRDLKSMESFILNQNDSVRDLGLCLMGKNDHFEIGGAGYTTTFTHKKSGGQLSCNRSGTTAESKEQGYRRITMQSFNQTAPLSKFYAQNYLSPELDTNSLIHSYIEGQQRLLEQLAKEYSN